MSTRWTADKKDHLRRRRGDGASFTIIGGELKMSRNACIGMAHRMGLFTESVRKPKQRTRVRKAVIQEPSLPKFDLPPEPEPVEAIVVEAPVKREVCKGTTTLMELNAHTCRWPHGEGLGALYCGMEPEPDKPYCKEHCRRAYYEYAPPSRRRQFTPRRHKPGRPAHIGRDR